MPPGLPSHWPKLVSLYNLASVSDLFVLSGRCSSVGTEHNDDEEGRQIQDLQAHALNAAPPHVSVLRVNHGAQLYHPA